MTPLFDRLLVKPIAAKEIETAGGIVLDSDKMEVAHESAEVISVGDDVRAVNVGDVVWYGKGSGSPMLLQNGETLYLLREQQLDCVD
jgi:co-chaperonin GroES (HSP10)